MSTDSMNPINFESASDTFVAHFQSAMSTGDQRAKSKREGEKKNWKREMEIYLRGGDLAPLRQSQFFCPTEPSSPLPRLVSSA